MPFILMHPKPDDDEPLIGGERSPGRTIGNSDKLHPGAGGAGGGAGTGASDLNKNSTNRGDASKEDGPNLIQLDGDENCPDDDIIFEDFARLRLKGAETEA